jgi:septal ring factor EnvC (AmiA/AmiB activator)
MHPVTRPSTVVPAVAILAALGLLPLATASAQTTPRPPAEVPYLNFPPAASPTPAATTAPADQNASPPVPGSPAELDALKKRDQELEAVRTEQRRALDNEAKLKREIDSIGDDRRKLNQQLIETAARVRAAEEEIGKGEDRLAPLADRERVLHNSLDKRRNVLAEVLAALQRIGRHPPPAILVRPEDALQSVRSAILLGAVLPEMRHESEALVADLAELVRLRRSIADERIKLEHELVALADERQRLTMFGEQRRKQQSDTEQALGAERQRAANLARQAEDLKDLIARLEDGLDSPGRAARGLGGAGPEKKALDNRPDLATLKDPGRLAPSVAFASARGILPLPVNGVRIREFGAPDGLGGSEKGLSIAVRPGAQVTTPCDGWVVYAGPFRNYGQLLILNAGDGYHVLLAGMDRISVDLGQFVLTGEPVAVMGGPVHSAAALAIGSGQPILYVEFRKDGSPVDPSPWWAASEGEKVRG